MSEREEFLRGLLGHLRSQKAAGVRYASLGAPRKAAPARAESPEPARAPEPESAGTSAQPSLLSSAGPQANLAPMAKRRSQGPAPPPLPFDPDADMPLDALHAAVDGCLRCKLGETRANLVFGVGNPDANLAIVGEAPGASEDAEGVPFVGRAGQMLTKMIENVIEVPRQEVYICNILKCRPPGNRDPEPDEIDCCEPYLHKQLAIIRPRLILALGRFAAQWLLQTKTPIGRLRGKFGRYQGIPCLSTYHPAYLLRNPRDKRVVMDDLLKAKAVYHGEQEARIELFS